jgi:hypothetical protein
MKILKVIIILIALFGLSITFIPAAGYIAAKLGIANLAILSIRPDKNMEYSISITLPNNVAISFSGQTGCQHKVGVNGSGYSTLNKVSTDTKKEWLLYGINCNYGISNKYHSGYRLFNLSSPVTTGMYFANDSSPAKITKEVFKSTIFSRLSKTETKWPSYDAGPYFYRKVTLKEKIPLEAKAPVVVYNQQTCGKANPEDKRHQQGIDYNLLHYQKYSSGMLGYSPKYSAWEMTHKIEPEKPLQVAELKYKKGTYIPKSGPPPGCLFIKYGEEKFIVSENSGAFLYIPEENTMISIERIHASDFKKSIEDIETWEACETEVDIPILFTGEVYIDRSKYTKIHRGVEMEMRNSRLIKNISGQYKCSKFQRMRWL